MISANNVTLRVGKKALFEDVNIKFTEGNCYGPVSYTHLPQYNIDVARLEEAYSEKTKAVMIAHTLGNPFDLAAVKAFCDRHGLWLVEDNCDALGTRYTMNGEEKFTGTVGDIGTSSF